MAQGNGESKKYAGLLRQWESFGNACGLDAEKERKRHRREGRAFCTWAVCQWSTTKPPDGVTLKACQGCGEAQYCGHECQKRCVWALIRVLLAGQADAHALAIGERAVTGKT